MLIWKICATALVILVVTALLMNTLDYDFDETNPKCAIALLISFYGSITTMIGTLIASIWI